MVDHVANRGTDVVADLCTRLLAFFGRDTQLTRRDLDAVEGGECFAQRFVAPFAHVGNQGRDLFAQLRRHRPIDVSVEKGPTTRHIEFGPDETTKNAHDLTLSATTPWIW